MARRFGGSLEVALRQISKHSAMPVSDENDSSVSAPAMLTTVMSVYRVAINFLNFAQDDPFIAVNGKYH